MKKYFATMIVSMMVACSISILSVGAQTRSSEDDPISAFTISPTNYNKVPARAKENSTPIYLWYKSATNNRYEYVYVRAYAGGTTHYTLNAKAVSTDHVTCTLGNKYLIRTNIYESKKDVATLGFKGTNIIENQTISGMWSPDSVGTYQYAD